jgi:threonine dehydrogenase-like Zn-dependent dehydrogenase
VAVHAIHKVRIQPIDTLVVLGAGAIGLSIAQAAKAAGARLVIVVDTLSRPLAVAKTVGADEVIDAMQADVVDTVASLTGGQGADVVFETVGGRAPTLLQATKIASRGGMVGIVGTFVGSHGLEPLVCQSKELTVRWVYSYGLWDGVPEFKIALDMLAAGRLKASPLITHHFPLDLIADAFAAANNKGQSGAVKVVVLP